jgi:hypothetical protein
LIQLGNPPGALGHHPVDPAGLFDDAVLQAPVIHRDSVIPTSVDRPGSVEIAGPSCWERIRAL